MGKCANSARIIGADSSGTFFYFEGHPRISSWDGINATPGPTMSISDTDTIQTACRWIGTSKVNASNGVEAAAGIYDESWDTIDIHILNRNGIADFVNGTISDFRLYTKDLGKDVVEAITDYD